MRLRVAFRSDCKKKCNIAASLTSIICHLIIYWSPAQPDSLRGSQPIEDSKEAVTKILTFFPIEGDL